MLAALVTTCGFFCGSNTANGQDHARCMSKAPLEMHNIECSLKSPSLFCRLHIDRVHPLTARMPPIHTSVDSIEPKRTRKDVDCVKKPLFT